MRDVRLKAQSGRNHYGAGRAHVGRKIRAHGPSCVRNLVYNVPASMLVGEREAK